MDNIYIYIYIWENGEECSNETKDAEKAKSNGISATLDYVKKKKIVHWKMSKDLFKKLNNDK